jgi:hypothetical protein
MPLPAPPAAPHRDPPVQFSSKLEAVVFVPRQRGAQRPASSWPVHNTTACKSGLHGHTPRQPTPPAGETPAMRPLLGGFPVCACSLLRATRPAACCPAPAASACRALGSLRLPSGGGWYNLDPQAGVLERTARSAASAQRGYRYSIAPPLLRTRICPAARLSGG